MRFGLIIASLAAIVFALVLSFLIEREFVPLSSFPERSVYDFKVKKTADGKETEVSLSDFSDDILLIFNSASLCGFTTPGLSTAQDLHERFGPNSAETKAKNRGVLRVLAFPTDNFNQELADHIDTIKFALTNFSASFPIMDRINVTGPASGRSRLFSYLQAVTAWNIGGVLTFERKIEWNFVAFLVLPRGGEVTRFTPFAWDGGGIEAAVREYFDA